MFENLQDRLGSILNGLTGRGALSEADVSAALREVRRALLEADVALEVVRAFTDKVREKAIGAEVLKSIKPGQMVVKIVHDELVEMLGSEGVGISLHAATDARAAAASGGADRGEHVGDRLPRVAQRGAGVDGRQIARCVARVRGVGDDADAVGLAVGARVLHQVREEVGRFERRVELGAARRVELVHAPRAVDHHHHVRGVQALPRAHHVVDRLVQAPEHGVPDRAAGTVDVEAGAGAPHRAVHVAVEAGV